MLYSSVTKISFHFIFIKYFIKFTAKSAIAGDTLQPEAWQKIQLKEAEMNKVPPAFVDTAPQQAPVFTRHLENKDKLVEGQHVYLEAQVEPRTDPNLRVEWFKNGVSLTTGMIFFCFYFFL